MSIIVDGGNKVRAADTNVELMRQQEILRALRYSTLEPHAMIDYVKELLQRQVLTQDVCHEVHDLFIEKGLNVPGGKPEIQDDRSCSLDESSRPASRFQQDFHKIKHLGRGGFGEVWHVRSRVDRKEYAVKIVPYTYSDEQDPFDHPALREAVAWANLQHPNMVQYHTAWVELEDDSIEAPNTHTPPPSPLQKPNQSPACEFSGNSDYISTYDCTGQSDIIFESTKGAQGGESPSSPLSAVHEDMQIMPLQEESKPVRIRRAKLFLQMELVRHGTLRDWLDKRNADLADGLPGDQLSEVRIFSQLVDVVQHLHAQGFVHRDIKPTNILLTENGEVRLADFGLLKDASPGVPRCAGANATALFPATTESAGRLGHTRQVGTPSYASPEQMKGQLYGAQADIHALGVVLAELLCPVDTQMERAALFEALRNKHLPQSAQVADAFVSSLVLRMTSSDPEQRPTAKDLKSYVFQYALRHGWAPCETPIQLETAETWSDELVTAI